MGVEGLVADGVDERGLPSLDLDTKPSSKGVVENDGGVFSAHGAASEPASQTTETPRSVTSGSGGGENQHSSDEVGVPTVTRHVAESFSLQDSHYGEVLVVVGDIIQACETRIQNGRVYGYKNDAWGEI